MSFTWDDGEQAAYETEDWIPNVESPRERRQQLIETLDLGTFLAIQKRAGSTDLRAPAQYNLAWEVCDQELIDIIEETWSENRAVDASFTHRGETVELTSYYVTAFEAPELAGGLYGLRITLQEVRV